MDRGLQRWGALGGCLLALVACTREIRERCRFVNEHVRMPALPAGFAEVDRLLIRRVTAMTQASRELRSPLVVSFRIWFAEESLPILCERLERARALALAGRVREAGVRYQSLLLALQVYELAIAMHTFSQWAGDRVPIWRITDMQELFVLQMGPLLDAALAEDPARMEQALAEHGGQYGAWVESLGRWSFQVSAHEPKLRVAEAVWNVMMLVIATRQAAVAAAELVAAGRPPMPPLPAFAATGGAGAVALSPAAAAQLAEALRKLIILGAMDAPVVAGLSLLGAAKPGAIPPDLDLPTSLQMSGLPGQTSANPKPNAEPSKQPTPTEGAPARGGGQGRAARFGDNWQRVSLRETIARIAGPNPVVSAQENGKILYSNPQTGVRVVYDRAGNYFRVEDPRITSNLRYLDQHGRPIPANTPILGPGGTTMTGVPTAVRNSLTHFINSDPSTP